MRKRDNDVLKKRIYGILLAAVMVTILLLTFQDSAGTAKLSETFRLWFEKTGFHSDYHSFRSNAHLIVYFVLGIVLSLFGKEAGWKWWLVLIIGCSFGLVDEGLKVLLPTREFDLGDLIKNWIGIAVSLVYISVLDRRACNGK